MKQEEELENLREKDNNEENSGRNRIYFLPLVGGFKRGNLKSIMF